MIEPQDSEYLWLVIVGFIVAFVLAFGIGANDVANSFGTSVGSKVLTLRQACVIASIFECAGAILIGARVSDTVRKGIIDINSFNGTEELAMLGSLSALSGTGIWLIVASFFKLPVSGTHSVVGATMGFALVAHGLSGIKWKTFALIAASWVISPLMSGLISSVIFFLVRRFILRKMNSFEIGLAALPIFYALTILINFFSVFYKGSHMLGFNKIPLYGVFILTFGSAIVTAVLVRYFVCPYLRKKILNEMDVKQAKERRSRSVKFSESHDDEVHCVIIKENGLEDKVKSIPEETLQNGKESVPAPADHSDKPEENSLPTVTVCPPDTTQLMQENSGDTVDPPDEAQVGQENPVDIKSPPEPDPEIKDDESATDQVASESSETSPGSPGSSVITSSTEKVQLIDDEEIDLEEHQRQRSMSDLEVKNRARSRAMSGDIMCLDEHRTLIADEPKTGRLFSFLQILTASFGAFAHGGNDVSNAIGPLISLWTIYWTGEVQQKVSIPVWILVFGGVGISIGLWVWGRRVIKTIGEDLTPITPSSGFTIEIGSAMTVLTASNLGIPISTTHCKVGSVVMVGRVRSKEVVDWSLFRNVVLAWVVTMPVTGGISAAVYAALRGVV